MSERDKMIKTRMMKKIIRFLCLVALGWLTAFIIGKFL